MSYANTSAAATTTVPEVALSTACLTTISPHLGGVYAVNVYEGEVKLQGRAYEVNHLIANLNLTRSHRLDHADGAGNRYETWEGPGPGEFADVNVTLIAVYRKDES